MKKIFGLMLLAASLFASVACSSKEEGSAELPTGESTLSVTPIRISNDGVQEAIFTVKCEGVDVTEHATIYLKGEKTVAIEGNTFSSTENGKFTFFANYSNLNTNTVDVTVAEDVTGLPEDPDPDNFDMVNRVALMQFTGTGCGYCPNIIAAIHEVSQDETYRSKFEHVAVHSYNNSDPMHFTDAVRLSQAAGVSGAPWVTYNLYKGIKDSNLGNVPACVAKIKESIDQMWVAKAEAGLCATVTRNGDVITVNAEVKAAVANTYHVGAFLLESDIEAKQSNYGSPIEGCDINIHENALRAVAGGNPTTYDFSGDDLGMIDAEGKGSLTLQFELEEKWKIENCHVLIYVTSAEQDGASFQVKNIISAPLEGIVEYAYN